MITYEDCFRYNNVEGPSERSYGKIEDVITSKAALYA